VTAAEGFNAETSVIESWWPKNVSMTDRVDIEARARWRDKDAVRIWYDGLSRGGNEMA